MIVKTQVDFYKMCDSILFSQGMGLSPAGRTNDQFSTLALAAAPGALRLVLSKSANLSRDSFSYCRNCRIDLESYLTYRMLGGRTSPFLCAMSSQLMLAKNSWAFTSSASLVAPSRLLGLRLRRRRMIWRAS